MNISQLQDQLESTLMVLHHSDPAGTVIPHTYSKNIWPGRVAQSVGHLTRKSEVLGSIPGLATYFRFSFR